MSKSGKLAGCDQVMPLVNKPIMFELALLHKLRGRQEMVRDHEGSSQRDSLQLIARHLNQRAFDGSDKSVSPWPAKWNILQSLRADRTSSWHGRG